MSLINVIVVKDKTPAAALVQTKVHKELRNTHSLEL